MSRCAATSADTGGADHRRRADSFCEKQEGSLPSRSMGLAIGNNVPSLSASPTTPLAINGETDTICSLMGGIFVE